MSEHRGALWGWYLNLCWVSVAAKMWRADPGLAFLQLPWWMVGTSPDLNAAPRIPDFRTPGSGLYETRRGQGRKTNELLCFFSREKFGRWTD
jgi:hypothetical protein